MFQFKPSKIPFQLSSRKFSQPLSSSNQSSFKVAAQQPLDMMDRMVAARFALLVLPQPLNALPGGYYQKYLPRFNG